MRGGGKGGGEGRREGGGEGRREGGGEGRREGDRDTLSGTIITYQTYQQTDLFLRRTV